MFLHNIFSTSPGVSGSKDLGFYSDHAESVYVHDKEENPSSHRMYYQAWAVLPDSKGSYKLAVVSKSDTDWVAPSCCFPGHCLGRFLIVFLIFFT